MESTGARSPTTPPHDGLLIAPRLYRACRRLGALLLGTVLLIAGSNLLAWLTGLAASPYLRLMRVNTALALTLGAISLWLWRKEQASALRQRIASILGFVVTVIGGMTALQYFTGCCRCCLRPLNRAAV